MATPGAIWRLINCLYLLIPKKKTTTTTLSVTASILNAVDDKGTLKANYQVLIVKLPNELGVFIWSRKEVNHKNFYTR